MFPSYFFVMIHKNFMDQIRQTKRNMMLFIIPVFIFSFIYIFFTTNKVELDFIDSINIGLVVDDESEYFDMLANSFNENEEFRELVVVTYGNQTEIDSAFNKGDLDAVISVPEDFVDSLMYFEYSPIIVKVNYQDPFIAILIKNFMLAYEEYITSVEVSVNLLYDTLYAEEVSGDVLYSYNETFVMNLLLTAFAREDFFLREGIVNIPSVLSVTYYFISILVMFIMYISVFVVISLIRERESNCFSRLKVSKMSVYSYIFSKAISTTLFIVLIVLCWYLMYVLLLGGQLNGALLSMFLLLGVIILFDIAFVMCVSAFMDREEGVILLCDVIIFINSIIGGSIIPIHYMPQSMEKLSSFSPVYWMIKGLLYYESGYNLSDAHMITSIIFLGALVLLMVTGIRYNRRAKF